MVLIGLFVCILLGWIIGLFDKDKKMEDKQLILGEDNICPVTKEYCDDECCPVGSICNLSSDKGVEPEPITKSFSDF